MNSIHHDINNAFTCVCGYIEILKSKNLKEIEPFLDDYEEVYKIIKKFKEDKSEALIINFREKMIDFYDKIEHLDNLNEEFSYIKKACHDCIDRSLNEKNKRDYISLDSIVEERIKKTKLHPQFKDYSIDSSLRFFSKDNYIFANKTQIESVLDNILFNAYQSFENKSGKILVSIKREGIYYLTSFFNNGKPIPESLKDKIGKIRFSTKKYEDGKCGGQGIGILSSINIINNHKGNMNWYSNENGTTFYVRLPAVIKKDILS